MKDEINIDGVTYVTKEKQWPRSFNEGDVKIEVRKSGDIKFELGDESIYIDQNEEFEDLERAMELSKKQRGE